MSKGALILLTAIITAIVTSMFWAVAGVFAYIAFSGPAPFAVSVDAPDSVTVGEEFELAVTVQNVHDTAAQLGSIDIYDSFLDGFDVVSVSPEPTEELGVLDFRSFYFEEELGVNESTVVVYTLKAAQAGLWSGDVDCCTPSENFSTATAVVRVVEE